MTPADFRIALSFPNTEESSHMGCPDFRLDGRIFATLAAEAKGYGNLMLTPAQQAEFVAEAPDLFLPVPGGWRRMGITHIRLDQATELTLTGALQAACKLRLDKTKPAATSWPARNVLASQRLRMAVLDQGPGRMTVFNAKEDARTMDFHANDVGFAPTGRPLHPEHRHRRPGLSRALRHPRVPAGLAQQLAPCAPATSSHGPHQPIRRGVGKNPRPVQPPHLEQRRYWR